MKPTIVADYTSASFLIHWLVLEKECPIEVVLPHDTWDIPVAEPPYYRDDEVLIYDHATLVQFLQERYPGYQLLPADPISRALIRQACTLVSEPDVDILAEVRAILDTGSRYMAGREFTLLDIYIGTWLSANYTPDNSSVRSYWERISKRSAYMEALQ